MALQKEVINMKTNNLWHVLLNRFFIWIHLTKKYGRPSNDKEASLHTVKGMVLPDKKTVMIDEFSGYTKTKVKIEQGLEGTLNHETIIEIYEPYYEGHYGGKKCMIVHESYEPLIVGETYTFLISKDKQEVSQFIKENAVSTDVLQYKELYHKAS